MKEARVFPLFILALFSILTWNASAQSADDVSARRAELQNQLNILESQIEAQKEIIKAKAQESASLERDIAIFNAKIKEANLSIQARDLAIKRLTSDISAKQKTIGTLTEKLARELGSLAQIIRATDRVESVTLLEVVLAENTVSDIFSDLDRFSSVQSALNKSREVVARSREATEEEKKTLEEKKIEETELRTIQMLEKKRIEKDKAAKDKLLKETRGQEAVYQKILAARQKDAATIRSELFMLQGSKAINFGRALQLATIAQKKTGVRPAFLLGVITEETNLGENVGTGNWRTDMHPTRDQPIFQQITGELGLNPDAMPVSKKPWYGWGGAMGPAQFIPSTWVLYKDKIAAMTGHNPPNPWDPYDAFMGAAILLKENGGAGGNYAKERLAALRYFAGWKNATKKAYAFYGDDVMSLASKYQEQINILKNN